MNAIAIRQPTQVAADHDPNAMFKMAQAIAQGKLFGSQDPNAVFTLMLLAQAEGKHPGLVMRDYHVISGKPAKKADAMLVDFLASGGKVEWHALDDKIADATFSHPMGGSVRISWDDERVKKAGLGSNPMHAKYPRQMKRARVISEGVRTVYPGATGGLYVPEEVQDFDAPVIHDTKPLPAPKRAKTPTPFDRPETAPAAVEEATGHEPADDAGEAAAPASGGFDLGEPEYVQAARGIEAALKAAEYPSDLEAIRRMKAEWGMVKRGDPSLFETLGRIAKQVEARLVGDDA